MSFTQAAQAASTVVADTLFTKSLSQMIKGIRGAKDKNQHEFIAQCLAEIKKELTSTDHDFKTEALKKLIFLQMMGYDMSWAAFHIIEVMSFPWFGHRRVGYLAASLAFNQTTDLILLTTNLLQKAFQQQSLGAITVQNPKLAEGLQYELGSAISCFASIVTPALANDLLQDVLQLLTNSRPYIRKRAILALYSIFHKHPPALRIAFDSLLDKLGDENPSVNSSVVYVLCELISKTPKNYLDLAPQFFHILTSSSNNWVLIKIVKIMGYLVPFEPRLAKKLQEPLSSIITTTPAKSLLYECVNTLLCGQIGSRTVVRLCLDKLRELVESPDQNLKYLGLLGLHKLINSFPRIVVQHKDLILDCLNDPDITICTRALDLVTHLVTPNNLPGVVRKLLQHINAMASTSALSSPINADAANQGGTVRTDTQLHSNQYHNTVIAKILELCTQDQYSMIADFEWFFFTLIDFTRIKGVSYENVLRIQDIIKDLLLSIPDLRPFAVNHLCVFLLGTTNNTTSSPNTNPTATPIISTCHLLQDVYHYTLLHELQLTESVGHYTTIQNTQSKLKKQVLQQIHNQKQHQYKQISSTHMQFNPMVEVLATISWCIGEYVVYSHSHAQLLQCFLLHPCIPYLSSVTQGSFLFAAMKIYYNAFQQPWFPTIDEAKEYEMEQHKLHKAALIQARSLRQNSILPPNFDIDDAENYEQKMAQDDEDEDDLDEDDEETAGIKGGHISLSSLGHNIAVGRTFAQHVQFLEQTTTLLLSGLNMYIYHTPYPEVQDRAHVLFNYLVWTISQLGTEFGSTDLSLPPSNTTSTVTVTTDNNNNQTIQPTSEQSNNKKQSDAVVDLTSLIFKEQQQNSALESLIAGNDDNNNNTNNDIQQQTYDFDPLNTTSLPSPAPEQDTTPQPTTTTTPITTTEIEKVYSQDFVEKLRIHVRFLAPLFSEELVPLSAKTQKKVPIPQGLDLEECLYDLDLDKEKPLFDDKTHPLFPIGQHVATSNYISSKDIDKRYDSSSSSKTSIHTTTTTSSKGGGFSFSSSDFDTNGNLKGGSNTKKRNDYGGDDDNNDNDDDDLFAPKDTKKKDKKGSANASIQARHTGDPFYIGASSKTNDKTKPARKAAVTGLTLDDFDGNDIQTSTKSTTKKMTIKKQQTKALVEDDDDNDNNDDDLLAPKAAVTKKGTKKVTKKQQQEQVQEQQEDVKPTTKKKKGTKKVTTTTPDEQEQPTPNNNTVVQLAPFIAPFGTIQIYQSESVSVYARARPYLTDNSSAESISQPIILIAVTIVLNPDGNHVLPMFQLSIQNNKATTVLTSPVPQPTIYSQSVLGSGGNVVYIQAKNLSSTISTTCYFAIQWNSSNISTSSRYFDFDLKFMLDGELIQYVNPTTNHNQLTLPTSIFLQPQKVTMAFVQDLLTASDNPCTFSETYIATCSSQQEIIAILKGVEAALNVSLVEAANKTAVYYGQCITLPAETNRIFAYIKCTDDSRVHITVKTSSQVLSTKLVEDCVQLLHLEQDE